MAEKMKLKGIYSDKDNILMPNLGQFNENHSKNIRKAA